MLENKNIVPNIGGCGSCQRCRMLLCSWWGMKRRSFPWKLGKLLCIGDELLHPSLSEAVKTKVPTVKGKLSFTGEICSFDNRRYQNRGISSKLSPKESRECFQKLAASSIRMHMVYHSYKCKRWAKKWLNALNWTINLLYKEPVKFRTRGYSCLKGAEAIFERAEK